MLIKKELWGDYNDKTSSLYTITDPKTGFEVQISDFGATVIKVLVPDRNNELENVNFGQNSPQDLVEENGYLGATIGRVANRIGNSKFMLDGKEYGLYANNGKHSLHGGKIGFNYRFWNCIKFINENDEAILVFEYNSPDGEEGYPGNLTTELTFRI